jgi:hypothetical protein
MPTTDSDHPQKVVAIHRIHWSTRSGFDGRHHPDSVVALHRIHWSTWAGLRTMAGGLVDIVVATTGKIDRLGNLTGLVYKSALDEGKVLYERAR